MNKGEDGPRFKVDQTTEGWLETGFLSNYDHRGQSVSVDKNLRTLQIFNLRGYREMSTEPLNESIQYAIDHERHKLHTYSIRESNPPNVTEGIVNWPLHAKIDVKNSIDIEYKSVNLQRKAVSKINQFADILGDEIRDVFTAY